MIGKVDNLELRALVPATSDVIPVQTGIQKPGTKNHSSEPKDKELLGQLAIQLEHRRQSIDGIWPGPDSFLYDPGYVATHPLAEFTLNTGVVYSQEIGVFTGQTLY